MPILSVIVPAYNEADNIDGCIGDVLADVASVVPDIEIIVVDDGSTDDTAARARAHAEGEPRLSVVSQPNQGHGPALVRGMEAARGQWLLLIDCDRQVSLKAFADHWAMSDRYDVILGIRWPRHDPFHRRVISLFMRALLGLALGVNLRDGGAPYKLLRRDVWVKSRVAMRPGCWIPSVLIAASALKRGDIAVLQLPIVHRARTAGPSTLNLPRLVRFCREGIADIFHFRRQRSVPVLVPDRND